jgi:hypothetical protein
MSEMVYYPDKTRAGQLLGTGIGSFFGAPTIGHTLGGLATLPWQMPKTQSVTLPKKQSSSTMMSPSMAQQPQSARPTAASAATGSTMQPRLDQMTKQYAANQNRLAAIARQSQVQANAQNRQMGGYVDNAMRQAYDQNVAAQGVLRGMMGDPQLNKLISDSFTRQNNPGFSRQAISTMKGNALARNAASAASQQRNGLMAGNRMGMGGPALAYMQSMLRNRNGYQSSREQGDIDLNIEQAAMQDKSQATGQTASLIGMRNGIGSQLADLMTRYNPMGQLSAGQSIMQPFQQIGYGIGNAGFGGM